MKKYYDENPNTNAPKGIDILDAEKLAIAHPGDIVLSTAEKPIIGTHDITNGVVVIITNGNNEYALGHFLADFDYSIYGMLNSLAPIKPLKVKVIPGVSIIEERVNQLVTFLCNKNNITLYGFDVEVLNLKHYANKEGGIDIALDTTTGELLKPDFASIISVRRV